MFMKEIIFFKFIWTILCYKGPCMRFCCIGHYSCITEMSIIYFYACFISSCFQKDMLNLFCFPFVMLVLFID